MSIESLSEQLKSHPPEGWDEARWRGCFDRECAAGTIEQSWGHFSAFLKLILAEPERQLMLEIGSYRGGSTRIFRELVPEVISLDLRGTYQHEPDIAGSSQSTEVYEALLEKLDGRKLDVVFIDGAHDYAGVRADFEKYAPLVRDGGLIGLHDTTSYGNSLYALARLGTADLFTELSLQENPFYFHFGDPLIDIPFDCVELGGLGVLRWQSEYADKMSGHHYSPALDLVLSEACVKKGKLAEALKLMAEADELLKDYRERLRELVDSDAAWALYKEQLEKQKDGPDEPGS